MLGGGRASGLGWVIDEYCHQLAILFERAAKFKSCPRNHEDPTNTAILPDGGFFVFGRVLLLAAPMGCGKRCKAALKNAVILVY